MGRRALVVLAVLLAGRSARAGNDDEIIQGNDAALSGGAVTAVVKDGSGVWYNPAGLAQANSDTLDVSANAFIVRLYNAPGLLTSADQTAATDSLPEYVVAPAAVTFVRTLTKDLSLGLGIFVTKASDLSLRADIRVPKDVPTTAWLLALSRRVNLYHAGIGVGWAPDPRLRVGATVFAVYESGSGSSQLAGGLVAAEDATGFQTASSVANYSRLGARLVGGVQWEASDNLRVGLSLLSQGVVLNSSFAGSSIASELAPGGSGSFFAAIPEREEPFFSAFAPYRMRGGLAWVWGDSFVAADFDYQTELKRPLLQIDRLAVWNARLGARVALWEDLAVGAGLFSDRNSDPPPSGFGDGALDLYGFTFGVTWESSLLLQGEKGELPLTFATTLGGRYAYGRGDFLGLAVEPIDTSDRPVRLQPAQLSIHELTFHLGSSVRF